MRRALTMSLLVAVVAIAGAAASDCPPRIDDAAIAAAERGGNVKGAAVLAACRAEALLAAGSEAAAEAQYLAAASLARRAGDAAAEADALGAAAELQYSRGAMADALLNIQAAYRIDTRLGRGKAQLDALSIIANIYADAKVAQYDRALEYYRQLAVGYEKLGAASDVADTIFNFGSTLEAKGDYAAAEVQYRRALAAFETLARPADVAYTRRSLASALMKQDRAAEALPLLEASVAFYDRAHDAGNLAWARQFRGMAYRRLGRQAEALADLQAARTYFEREKNVRFLDKNAEEASLVHANLGDWRAAYAEQKRHGELQQALAASRRDELSSRLRVEFDAEKKEQENRALARENALRAAALREAQRNQKLQIAVIALTALLAIALAVLFRRQLAHARRMRSMAMTDELTRLPNRRHIFAAAEMAFAAARRERRPAAVIVLDIDHFKSINDRWGHAAGDAVLQAVARACRMELRPTDQIGRIGGEEFLVVLQVASAGEAHAVAERMRRAVERLDFSSIDGSLRVTISLGVHAAHDYATEAAVAAADAMLYRAKEGGRNRVVAAG